MRKILIIILAFLFSPSIKAEYNGYHITIAIEHINGQISKGYVYIAADYLNMDSLHSTSYLKKALDQSWKEYDKRDSLVYFKARIKYDYTSLLDSSKQLYSIYYLTSKTALSFQSIKRITIENMIDFGYTQSIANELKLSDTTWMKIAPLRTLTFSGYLISCQIFVHKESSKVNEIIKELEMNQAKIDRLDSNIENGQTDYIKGGKMDEALMLIIQKLNKQKVIVIVESSC